MRATLVSSYWNYSRSNIAAGATIDESIEQVRAATLFTTHTPVPAGIDRFERTLITNEMQPWADRLGISVDALLAWSVLPSDGPDSHSTPRHSRLSCVAEPMV